MKLYKYSLIAALALSGVLGACDDNDDYAPGASVAGDEVYFSLDESEVVDIPLDATSVDINVNRVKTDDALSVNFTYTLTDGDGNAVTDVFTMPSTVNFEPGKNVASIAVGVDFSKVVADEQYFLTVDLQGDNLTPYGPSKREFVLTYAPWSEWELVPGEVGVYTFTLLSSIKGDYDVEVVTRHSMVDENNVQYATVGPFTNGINFVYSMNLKNTIEVDGVECPLVTVENYYSSLENGGPGASDEFFWWLDVKYWIAEFWGLGWENVDRVMALNDLPQSIFNPKTGLFSLDVAVVSNDKTMPGTSAAYGVGYEYLQLPGYKSYEISFDYTGNYVDAKGNEYAIVNAFKTDDVASFVADIFNGELDEAGVSAAIEDIKAADDLESYTESTTNLAFVCEENGLYTVVGIGYDENGNEVCNAAYTFNYSTVKADDPWETIGYCEYTDGFVNSCYSKLGGETWDVEIQVDPENPGLYRLVNPYEAWAKAYAAAGVTYGKGNYYIVINAANPDQVYLEESNIGLIVDPADGQWIVSSLAFDAIQNGYPDSEIAKLGMFGTLSDGLITFPTDKLLVSFQNDNNWYYGNRDYTNPSETSQFGPGTFCVDLNVLNPSEAPKRVKAAGSPVKSAQRQSEVKSERITSAVKTIDAKTLQNYRSANPRQFKF